jgi:hypothetical protein
LATVLSFGNDPLLTTTLSYLSSRAKPRDLQFYGPFLEKLLELGLGPVVGGD